MLHVLSGAGVHIIDGAGQVHIKVGIQMGLGQDDLLDISHGETGQNDPGDEHDQQEGPQDLPYHAKHMQHGRGLLLPPAGPGLRVVFIRS